MKTSHRIGIALLAIAGIVAAAGIGVLANAIAGDSIGLSASPLRAGKSLAPDEARQGDDHGRNSRHGHSGRGRDHPEDNGATGTTTTSTGEPTTTPAVTTTTDDHGSGVEPGDDSGSSSSSGPGSSGSSGSGSSGSSGGSDDSGGGFDD